MEDYMAGISKGLSEFLFKQEGNAGHPAAKKVGTNKSPWGQYLDSAGYATTGIGMLVSKNEYGTSEYQKDREKFESKWSNKLGKPVNVDEVDEETAYEMKSKYVEEALADKSVFGGVDPSTLPEAVVTGLTSLRFQMGSLGPKTKQLIRNFDKHRDQESLRALSDEVRNYQKNNPEQQKLFQKRRDAEADSILSTLPDLPTGNYRGPSAIIDEVFDELQLNASATMKDVIPKTNKEKLTDLGTQIIGSPNNQLVSSPIKEAEESLDKPVFLSDVVPNTDPMSIKDQDNIVRASADKNKLTYSNWSNNLTASLLTENIVGQQIYRRVLNTGLPIGDADPNFDPVKSKSWTAAQQFVPAEHISGLFSDVVNEQDMQNRLQQYIAESDIRKESSEYMQHNPITGFANIGLASVMDVTSLIPVSKVAQLTRLTKVAKGLPKVARTIGGPIVENLVQDMTQEAILTAQSDVRQFEDGDMLYGAIGGVMLGGAAGAFRHVNMEKKFLGIANKYSNEKSITMVDRVLERAKKDGYSEDVVTRIDQMKTKLEQDLENDLRVQISEKYNEFSNQYRRTYLDNQKIDVARKQTEFELDVDNQINSIKQEYKSKIQEVKKSHKGQKSVLRETVNSMESRVKGVKNRIKQLNGVDTPNARVRKHGLQKQLKEVETNLNTKKTELRGLDRKQKNELDKVVKEVSRLEKESNLDGRIKALQDSKETNLDNLHNEYKAIEESLSKGEGIPESTDWNIESFNQLLDESDIGKQFKDLDELDDFLGLKFADSAERYKPIGKQSMGAAGTKYLTKTDEAIGKNLDDASKRFLNEGLNLKNENPDLSLNYLATNKDSTIGRLLRQTKLNEYLNESSWWGRVITNINSLKNSDNPYASGLANMLFSEKGGRVNGSSLSVEEHTAKYRNIYLGKLKKEMNNLIFDLKSDFKTNVNLRESLGLQGNLTDAARVMGADFEASIGKLIRNEKLDNGISERLYGPEVAAKVNKFINNETKMMEDIVNTAKFIGVEGIDNLTPNKNYFHRAWDFEGVRGFISQYGERALIDLTQKGLMDAYQKEIVSKLGMKLPKALQEELEAAMEAEAKKFAFGLANADLRSFQKQADNFSDFLDKLENGNWDGIIDMDKFKAKASAELEALEKARKQILARKKQIDLTSSIEIETKSGVQKLSLSDLLHDNYLDSQNDFYNYLIPRIAFAEKGITDISKVEEMIQAASNWSLNKGDKAASDYIDQSFRRVMTGIRSGGAGPVDGDQGIKQALSFVKKYNYARLMQYTGISSMAEMGMAVSEAGYKATWDAASHSINHWYRTRKLVGASAEELQDELTESLGAITGIGLEGFNFAATRSTQSQIYRSGVMSGVEKFTDNMARVTHSTTSWIETATRRMTINAVALDMSNVMLGRRSTKSYLGGGLSDFNLVELGLAKRTADGIELNPLYKKLQENLEKHALDLDGNNAKTSGKRITSFQFDKWDSGVVKEFGDILTKRSNHILVNPDVSTQSLWHTSLIGSIVNQFKSFSQAAHAKVAMHNLNANIEAVKNRELAEVVKSAHKLFLGAVFGKVSLMTYSAVHNAGREDFDNRMAESMSISDYRDWTKALGRGSVLTGLDTSIDTGIGIVNTFNDRNHQIEGLFNSSTIGQSRNALNLGSTATGQIFTGALQSGQYAAQGEWAKAGNKVINMTPIRRTIGVNQLLNLIGVD